MPDISRQIKPNQSWQSECI